MTNLANNEFKNIDLRRCSTNQEYDFNSDVWTFKSSTIKTVINYKRLMEYATLEFVDDLKRVFFLSLHKLKPESVLKDCIAITFYLKYCFSTNGFMTNSITENNVSNYINNNSLDVNIKSFKVLIYRLDKFGFKYIDINSIKISKKIKITNNNGKSVLTADPYKGPLSPIELSGFLFEAERKFNNDDLSLKQYLLVYLCFCLGLRPTQIALLKIKDYYVKPNVFTGNKHYLNVPRVKQRGAKTRELLTERELHPNLAVILDEWIIKIKPQYEVAGVDNFDEMALIPQFKKDYSNECCFHYDANLLAINISNIGKKLNIVSDRINKIVKFNADRARKTLATRSAMEGASLITIAALLDHSTTNSVKHYVKLTREMATMIDDAIVDDISPLIQAFKGIVTPNSTPIPGTQRIISPKSIDFDTGLCIDPCGCGVYSESKDLVSELAEIPLYCYTCQFFNAFSHIETHKYYLELVLKRKDLMLRNGNVNNDISIDNYNFASSVDVTIKAIQEVIRIIESGEIDGEIDV